uniref:Uncharacterized protein n=1 Tax=Globodera rostochiensis TaxID=31243 RepID=A0A914HXB6_GLORO
MTSSSGAVRTRKRTVDHVVKKVFRRRVCLICFGFTVVFFVLLLAGATTLTVLNVEHLNEIKAFLRKQSSLKSRTDIEAFYEIECPIYDKKPSEWDVFETAFCNRYCDRNFKFEFMYRQLDPKKKFLTHKTTNRREAHYCPVYVELRQCQTEDGGHCEKKIFDKDVIDFNSTEEMRFSLLLMLLVLQFLFFAVAFVNGLPREVPPLLLQRLKRQDEVASDIIYLPMSYGK